MERQPQRLGSNGPFNSPADVGGPNPPGDVDVRTGQNVAAGNVRANPPGAGSSDVMAEGQRTRSDQEITSVCQRELDSALGWTGTRVAEARRIGLNNYFANMRGDEREGRSSVVTREVFESVEQLMPDLMEIFTSTNEVARFLPTEDKDEDASEQATDACNWVFQQNDGFMVLYTMFKDALIQKNGIVKVYWEESFEWQVEHYEGKTLLEFFEILEDPDLLVTEATAYIEQNGEREEIELEVLLGPEGGELNPFGVFLDARCKRVQDNGHVQLDNIPPEEFIINRDARGLDDATTRFVGHRVRTTASQLVAQGYDPDMVSTIPSSQSVYTTDQDAIVRSSQDDSFPQVWSYRQDEQRTIYINECYVKVDLDGDGISEWHKVVLGGDYGQVLMSADQVNYHPFASVTPIPVPHRFYGLSFSDITDDLQQINTTLWRQYLDSLYLANDPRVIVRSSGQDETAAPLCNLDQLLSSEVGGYVEEYADNAIRPFPTVTNSQYILPAFELHEQALQARTGISPDAAGVNPDMISKHVFGAMVQTSASARRVAMYARVFANTGVQRIFELIYKELMTHQTSPLMLRLRGEWTHVNPTDWVWKMDCQVNVGLGHGSRMEKATHVQGILETQRQAAEAGLTNIVGYEQVYNALTTYAEALGFKDTSKFYMDPRTQEPPQDEPSAEEKAIEAQQQIDLMKVELERQKIDLERDKLALDIKKVELDHEAKIYQIRVDAAGKAADAQIKSEGTEGAHRIPMDDPNFNLPQPPPMPMPSRPMAPPGAGGLTVEEAGMAPGFDEQRQINEAFRARGGM